MPYVLSPEQRKEAARMYLEEMLSVRQVATHFKRSAQAVRNALKSEGVTFREKWAARSLREDFPCRKYPNGRPKPEAKPEASYRRVNSVFQLGANR